MNTLHQIRRLVVGYAVMLTLLAVMSMVVGLSSRNVMSGVENPNPDRQRLVATVE